MDAAWARERFPSDPRLKVPDAIVAFMDGEYDRSEKLPRDVIESHPHDLLSTIARVDLVIVLRDEGREAESRQILGVVREQFAGTPITERAKTLFASSK